ncbi:AMP-binding protein [Sutcliffiella horikoshii]|uniref:AMP-binding protein n=1 Tax=Sutcliffiella horikoshii TaxID=79883 RepID=A0AA94WL71_9BACI|nr:AMP-binding protein [Sutcliffiella horikoshii]TYS57820.1 AMP-binding protein [Sutcliffiella horikoshii]
MFFINDQFYSKGDLHQQFERFDQMNVLRDCRKKRIAVCTNNVFDALALTLYIKDNGGSVVPIHAATPRDAAIRVAHKSSSHILLFENFNSPILMINDRVEKQGVLVQMSSGTTGEPKCLERSWEDIQEEIDSYNKSLPVDKGTVPIIACPISHSYGLISGVLTALDRETNPIILHNLNPKYVLKKLMETPNHLLYASPAFIDTLTKLSPQDFSFHNVMTSGMLMSAKCLEDLKSKTNRVLQQYGCSEAGCIAINPDVQEPHEMGFPLGHFTLKAGQDKNDPKEVIVHGKRKVIHTNDIGYINDSGSLCLLGRRDDMINVAGLNVYPHEVEEVLLKAPHIQEVVAYKKPDAFAGERVCVQFVASSFMEEARLRDWCVKQLAPHQVPVEYIQVEKIPTLPNGKISRKLVGEMMGC